MMQSNSNLEIAGAYIRVSTDDQTELSPDAQLRVILEAAKADGILIPPDFIFMEKKGISGRKADNRPEFQRMIAIAKCQTPGSLQTALPVEIFPFCQESGGKHLLQGDPP